MHTRLSICVVILFFTKAVYAEPLFTFAQIRDTPDQMVGAEILKAVYSKLGIDIKMLPMPGKRALKESSEGRVDGEVHRIFQVGEDYPTLIRVPTAINYIEPAVFSKKYRFKVTGCTALDKYSIGIVRGVKHAELCSKGLQKVQVIDHSIKMMQLLQAGRIDIAITAKINGLVLIKKMAVESIHVLSPPLSRMLVYHYVHRRHKDWVPKIDKVIIKMQNSGELENLRQEAIKTLLKNATAN
ncbi:MAG: hypothetical protein OFPI_09810 [Osedax symbiont Rs2]|nr:MAG: hypothetical protein OFPI_09810 [Osedax symbiont Rs2]